MHQAKHVDYFAGVLADCAAKGIVRLNADFLVTPEEGPRLHGWAAAGPTAAPARTAGGATRSTKEFELQARQFVQAFFQLLAPGGTAISKIYVSELEFSGGQWRKNSLKQIARVEPVETGTRLTIDADASLENQNVLTILEEDDPVAEVRAARQLVLTNAAVLIAEQDPTRLDNLIMAAAPFALARIRKLGGIARMIRPKGFPRFPPAHALRGQLGALSDVKLLQKVCEVRGKAGIRRADFKLNVAVARVRVDGQIKYISSENVPAKILNDQLPPKPGQPSVGYHSEMNILETIQQKHRGQKVVIEEIYSERIPCANCMSALDAWVKQYKVEMRIFYAVSEKHGPSSRADLLMGAYGLQ